MFIVKINNTDASSHTHECDALAQKERFITNGVDEGTIQIVEQDEFNPPQE